jgi:hypothetical protein
LGVAKKPGENRGYRATDEGGQMSFKSWAASKWKSWGKARRSFFVAFVCIGSGAAVVLAAGLDDKLGFTPGTESGLYCWQDPHDQGALYLTQRQADANVCLELDFPAINTVLTATLDSTALGVTSAPGQPGWYKIGPAPGRTPPATSENKFSWPSGGTMTIIFAKPPSTMPDDWKVDFATTAYDSMDRETWRSVFHRIVQVAFIFSVLAALITGAQTQQKPVAEEPDEKIRFDARRCLRLMIEDFQGEPGGKKLLSLLLEERMPRQEAVKTAAPELTKPSERAALWRKTTAEFNIQLSQIIEYLRQQENLLTIQPPARRKWFGIWG